MIIILDGLAYVHTVCYIDVTCIHVHVFYCTVHALYCEVDICNPYMYSQSLYAQQCSFFCLFFFRH